MSRSLREASKVSAASPGCEASGQSLDLSEPPEPYCPGQLHNVGLGLEATTWCSEPDELFT